MRIGLFGGSFNPVHLGHVNMVKRAIDEFSLDLLYVIPAYENPFKPGSSAVNVPWDRLRMVEDAFSGMEKVVVDSREIRRGCVSYAIDTVREIHSENKTADLFFITGDDCIADLPKWKNYDELVKLCKFVSLPRTKENSTEIRELFVGNGVVENPDAKIVAVVRAGLQRKKGFCPCRIAAIPENFCPCDEFKEQLKDMSFHGLCHCRLYMKP